MTCLSDLFEQEPQQWGLRGDAYLWREMRARLAQSPMPDGPSALGGMISIAFKDLTGRDLETCDDFCVERFAHGGMSSGFVCAEFWRNEAVPQLRENWSDLKNRSKVPSGMANEYILARQINWAENRGLDLVGSKGDRGRLAYTRTLNQNLFEPLTPGVLAQFMAGDGGEIPLHPEPGIPGKMNAVHSSSALGVNIFHYWNRLNLVSEIAAACGLCQSGSAKQWVLRFEEKLKIAGIKSARCPNIDVVIYDREENPTKLFAVECKFTEAYGGRQHPGLKQAYLDCEDLWPEIPALRSIAEEIAGEDQVYHHLHPAQLIKHVLGCRSKLAGTNGSFRLLYLWYDALGAAGATHQAEIDRFSEACKSDGVRFHALSYQELIANIAQRHRRQHPYYVKYITERYL